VRGSIEIGSQRGRSDLGMKVLIYQRERTKGRWFCNAKEREREKVGREISGRERVGKMKFSVAEVLWPLVWQIGFLFISDY
jgi:hypothetical protein